jgi:hypothetical protein
MLLRFFVRLGLFGLSLWLIPKGAMDLALPVYYRATGTVVEGEVVGFLAGRYGGSVQPENTGVRDGRRVARPPVYRYPANPGGPATLEGQAKSAFTFSFMPYELGETVTVVFAEDEPGASYLFEAGTLAGGTLIFGFGLLCAFIGLGGKL